LSLAQRLWARRRRGAQDEPCTGTGTGPALAQLSLLAPSGDDFGGVKV